ncbi:SIR2 family NAD-dependent protein deacylase [Paenibacillus piri]|uniref:SIR2 family protein n=1 Tax=Paenibacillus piri TaxID=2547395 RepID=A0A4V2ZST1_9BACL|nr:SIR2 family protein [Paenibacillus piri]TDF94394.1 SIR2 family protein [Paenibacillus piri]
MINFPSTLIEEISARRCIVFLGSGASASSVSALDATRRPPQWGEFLRNAIPLIHIKSDREEALRLLEEKSFLECAQVIDHCTISTEMNEYVRRELLRPRFQPSRLHDIIHRLDPKMVITTNYDLIYDLKCQDGVHQGLYSIKSYNEDGIINDIRSSRRLVIKAHGSATTPEKIILSREQYYRARRDYPHFYQVLDALLITNTVLFIGYSLRDPDILLTLENTSISFKSQNPHFAIIEEGMHPAIKNSFEKTYNVKFLEYSRGQHEVIINSLENIYPQVESYRETDTL